MEYQNTLLSIIHMGGVFIMKRSVFAFLAALFCNYNKSNVNNLLLVFISLFNSFGNSRAIFLFQ